MKRMMNNLDDVGQQIRNKFAWVSPIEEIDLVMDNAGGHGTKEVKAAYVTMLKQRHNIRVVWQTPQSPEMNLLDLGIWCSLQSMVELEHRKKCKSNRNALARTIEDVWTRFPASKFESVHQRWKKVLKIVCNTKGDNVKSDAFRGKTEVPEVNLDELQASLASVDNESDFEVDSDVDITVDDD